MATPGDRQAAAQEKMAVSLAEISATLKTLAPQQSALNEIATALSKLVYQDSTGKYWINLNLEQTT